MLPQSVDTLIVGGGPTGLTIAYILQRYGVNVHVVERYDRIQQSKYGRACVLYAASIEHFEALGIYDRLADIGFIMPDSITYKNGERVANRGWSFVRQALKDGHTFHHYSLGIRQACVEDALLEAIAEISPNAVHAPATLVDYKVTPSSEYPILAIIEVDGKQTQVACKYLVGADGGRSLVRSIGKFPFPGIVAPYKWIRLDAVVKTNMPSSHVKSVALESEKYGNVLWLILDHGRTRIGFVCPDEVYGEDGSGLTKEIIMETAQKAVHPFTLEFVTLDWWTVYQIGQRVAETFIDGHVILAGDSAHTHSSGSAQGMNTGIYDACNLGWKLAGIQTGKFHENILDTYDSERRASANHLISLDKDVSTLISGKIPNHFNAPPGAEVNDYLIRLFLKNAQFTVGLGVWYEPNLINQVDLEGPTTIKIGYRAPDSLVYRPGPRVAQRLRTFLPHTGRFWALVFGGAVLEYDPASEHPKLDPECSARYRRLRDHLDSSPYDITPVCNFLTIIHSDDLQQPHETISALPLGKTVHDHEGGTYAKFGVNPKDGAVVVVRPDGIVSFSTPLDGGDKLINYFQKFARLAFRKISKEVNGNAHIVEGEISIEGLEERREHSAL